MSSASRAHLDQLVEIDAGLDAHLLAHEHEILGADIAGGALVRGERAAAEAGDGGIEDRHAHLQPGIGVGDAHAARVVQVQRRASVRETLAHRADQRA